MWSRLLQRMRSNRGLSAWMALTAIFLVGGVAESVLEDLGGVAVPAAILMAIGIGLTWWSPLGGLGMMALVAAVQAPLGDPIYDITFPIFGISAALMMAAAREGGRRLAAAIGLAAIMIAFVVAPGTDALVGDTVISIGVLLVLPTLVGRTWRSRAVLNAELHERTQRLAREQQERADEAAAVERRRIAGDLHDLVAHGVSGMVVQTGAARRLVRAGDPRAAEAILAIEESGREALTELRTLLGVLRRDDADLALAPQPSLARVAALVERLRAGGLDIDFEVRGEPRPMSPGIDVTGYRIVEEALHGAHGSPRVVIAYGTTDVEVIVEGADADGAGLVGLRERVGLFGGELITGRRGGTLRARLPVSGVAA